MGHQIFTNSRLLRCFFLFEIGFPFSALPTQTCKVAAAVCPSGKISHHRPKKKTSIVLSQPLSRVLVTSLTKIIHTSLEALSTFFLQFLSKFLVLWCSFWCAVLYGFNFTFHSKSCLINSKDKVISMHLQSDLSA